MKYNVFNEILSKYNKECILSLCEKLNKKCNLKSSNDLEDLNILGTYMYIEEDYNNALNVFSLTDELKFNGNWDIWNEVYTSQILKARVYSKIGKEDIAEQVKMELNFKTTGGRLNWKSSINASCSSPVDEKYDFYIRNGISSNDTKYVFKMRIFKLIYLLKYIEGSVFKDTIYYKKVELADELIKVIKDMLY